MTIEAQESQGWIQIGDRVKIKARGKRKTFAASFTHNGQHTHRSLKTSNFKIARQRAIALEAEIAGGGYQPVAKPISVEAAAKEFIQAKQNEGKAHKTIVAYEPEVNLFVEFLRGHGVHLLTQLGPRHYEEYRALRHQTLAPKTLYTRLTIIKTFIKWAIVNREYLTRNPFGACRLSKPYVPPKFTPTLQQVDALLGAAKGEMQIQIAMLAYSGLRVGELQMLGTNGVDLSNRWIRVIARAGWIPKTRQARKIPVHPKLVPYLKQMTDSPRPYFFCASPSPRYPAGEHHINQKHLNENLQKLAKRLHIPVGRKNNGLVVHSLRHFFETQAVDSGVPQFVVDAWMGHAGEALMGRTYYGLTDDKSRAFMQQVKL